MIIRAVTALLGVSLLVAVWSYFGAQGLIAVCAIVTFIGSLEYSAMLEGGHPIARGSFVALSFLVYLIFSFYSQSPFVILCSFILMVSFFILFSRLPVDARMAHLANWTVGLLYCGILPAVVNLGLINFGGSFFIALLFASFLTDTFAYLGGRLVGQRPLAPLISPKKTIEGSLVGLCGGAGFAFWYLNGLAHSSPFWLVALLCVGASFLNQIGDLFESMLKRYSGVKDSGKIMPGHGGVLDRIDGLLFAGPVIYLWMVVYI